MCLTFHWFRSLTMTTQITIYTSLILAVIISILIILFQINLSLLLPLTSEEQRNMSFKQNKNLINSQLANYNRLISAFILINANELIAMHQLVLAQQQTARNNDQHLKYDYSGMNEIPQSLLFVNEIAAQQTSYSFMCGNNNQDSSNKLGELGPMMRSELLGLDSLIYGGIFNDPVMFYSYPCIHLGSNFDKYDITQRPWYIKAQQEHSKSDDFMEYQVKFTDPYAYASNIKTVDVSLVLPQINLQKQFMGAWAIDLQSQMFVKYLQQNNHVDMIVLVAESGILLVHNFNYTNSTQPLYFQNESVTGFSEMDWNSIKSNDVSNCNCDLLYSIEGIFCRVNKRMSKEYHLFVTHIKQYEMYVVMLYDSTQIREEINSQQQLITKFVQSKVINVIIYLTITFIIATVIVMITIRFAIVNPITKDIITYSVQKVPVFFDNIENIQQQLSVEYVNIIQFVTQQNGYCYKLQVQPEYRIKIIYWNWKGAICQLVQNKPQYYTPKMWISTLMERQNKHIKSMI